MKHKLNYRSAEECLHTTYKDMDGMTLDDAIIILSEPVMKYHEAKNDREHINLPIPRMIKAFELVIEAAKSVNMREKVREYITELDEEIKRCETECEKLSYDEICVRVNRAELNIWHSRINTLIEVKGDLESRLEELV